MVMLYEHGDGGTHDGTGNVTRGGTERRRGDKRDGERDGNRISERWKECV